MNDFNRSMPAGQLDMGINEGLRSFMLGVYNKMGIGLLLTAAIAYAVGELAPPNVKQILLYGPTGIAIAFAPLAILFLSRFIMRNPSPLGSNIVYWSVVSLIGVSMGSIVVRYGNTADGLLIVAKALLTTAIAFGGLSLWGYTTKKDISGWGSFLIMGLIGLIVASILNFFVFQSSMLQFGLSVFGVLIFAGLTAYDTQRLKTDYAHYSQSARAMSVGTTWGALHLYLNFVNLFQYILYFLGMGDE